MIVPELVKWYGPGRLTVETTPYDEVFTHFALPTKDVLSPTHRTVLEVSNTFRSHPNMPIEEVMRHGVRKALLDLYTHEIDENLEYDGRLLVNPHPSNPDYPELMRTRRHGQ